MTYEEHKQGFMDSPTLSRKGKQALSLLDDLDCVKALNLARTIYHMMQKRVTEAEAAA